MSCIFHKIVYFRSNIQALISQHDLLFFLKIIYISVWITAISLISRIFLQVQGNFVFHVNFCTFYNKTHICFIKVWMVRYLSFWNMCVNICMSIQLAIYILLISIKFLCRWLMSYALHWTSNENRWRRLYMRVGRMRCQPCSICFSTENV